MDKPRVVLVSMPWAPVSEPSLGLAILHAHLKQAQIQSRVFHASIALLRYVKFETYSTVSEFWGLNEFVFTEALSPGIDEVQLQALVEQCIIHSEGRRPGRDAYPDAESLAEMLLRFRDEAAPRYLEDCAENILADDPTLVGLTCLFDQTLASVALAKLIKFKSPSTLIALGGYALQGAPGELIVRAFPWIDCVAQGDGERTIVELANASADSGNLSSIDGLILRDGLASPAKNISLDGSATPNYDNWFDDVAAFQKQLGIEIKTDTLPVESSRGCWWGQHKHCVFCGIDDETLKFRHKSPQRVVEMLAEMRGRYGEHQFRFSDYILPRPYYEELLPRLAKISPKYHLKCEIKANHPPSRVKALADAGFREVQPGIESFSSNVLRLMDKGVSSIQNVALLKYGYREKVLVHYNFLYGLPGESPASYREMLANIPKIYHFFPPVARTEAIVTRFAPLHANPQRFGSNAKPRHHRCYDVLFSQTALEECGLTLDDYAYYFERYLEYSPEMQELYAQVVMQINHWKHRHRESDVYLSYEPQGDSLLFADSRFGTLKRYRISGIEAAIYLGCDQAPAVQSALLADVSSRMGCSGSQVADALARLDEERLFWRDGSHVLGLAVPHAIVEEHLQSQWPKDWTSIYL